VKVIFGKGINYICKRWGKHNNILLGLGIKQLKINEYDKNFMGG